MLRIAVLVIANLLGAALPCQTPIAEQLRVALVAGEDDPLATELRGNLRSRGMRVSRIKPENCSREAWWQADVVVIAWPAGLPVKSSTPLARWDRPTVFLGDTGERFAKAWGLPTPSQIDVAFLSAGPELAHLPFEGGARWCARQGNLVHVPKPLPNQRQAWLASTANTVRTAAHFRSDRPIIRIAHDPEANERERLRVRRMLTYASQLVVDPYTMKSLLDLPDMLRGSDQQQAEGLLVDLFPEGPGTGAARLEWMNWLRRKRASLVWDSLGKVWRCDRFTFAQGQHARVQRDARTEGINNDPRAIAIARKVVRYYGGSALNDLATFSCWHGDKLHCMWDRRRGYFRMENYFPDAQGAPKMWRVIVLDTASCEPVVWDRTHLDYTLPNFRHLIERAFLPLMLLEPGIGLRYLDKESDDKTAKLAVRLAGRNMNLRVVVLLTIDRTTGALLRLSRQGGGPDHEFTLRNTIPCGPLRLPRIWQLGPDSFPNFDKVEWNPTLPDNLHTSVKRLVSPRTK